MLMTFFLGLFFFLGILFIVLFMRLLVQLIEMTDTQQFVFPVILPLSWYLL